MSNCNLNSSRGRCRWAFVLATTVASLAAGPAILAGDDCCGGEKKSRGAAADAAADAKAPEVATGSLLVDLGNAKCPNMGGKPDGKTWSEWNGLRIGHCCGMCPAKFAADPEKALKRAGIEWKDAAAAVKKVNDAKGDARDKALAALKKRWTVVREPAAEEPAK